MEVAGKPAAQQADSDEEDEREIVPEHLSDAVEGSLHLKRLLSADVDAANSGVSLASANKKRKIEHVTRAGEQEKKKIDWLMKKWSANNDLVIRHVLEGLSLDELNKLDTAGYYLDRSNEWRGPAEMLANHVTACREQSGPSGIAMDSVTAFRFRWKLDPAQDIMMRQLPHKELRYVLKNFNGTKPLEDVVAEAKEQAPETGLAVGALSSHAPGAKPFGRFHRLELIDPTADAAVFGDANLLFALNLVRHRKALGHVGRVIATTFENLETLRERYKEIDETIKELEDNFADVYHEVDCTRIAIDPRFKGMDQSFGAVYYNFPHAGAAWVDMEPRHGRITGFYDSHPVVNWRHENLMRLFFRGLRYFVKPGGVVKVASNMGAVGVRYSYIIGSAVQNEFEHCETIPFMEWQLRRYGRAYGDRRDAYKRPGQGQGYNVQKAEADMVYTFEYRPSDKTLPKQEIRLPPTFKTLQACQDGPFKNLKGEQVTELARQLHSRFIKECSGIHVG
eukprot:TRINITY_DN21295_c0_g1_i1.p1 TRINITY_DN21295_c0_g1~~TRINITY_DN21295_c0_g1_i1.p1  ORF type:complete len:507 (+),score=110.91 TRINITY_DN21295_c0_g1_i1:71-1591(+)